MYREALSPGTSAEGEEEKPVMREAGKQPQVSSIPTLPPPHSLEGISEAPLMRCMQRYREVVIPGPPFEGGKVVN